MLDVRCKSINEEQATFIAHHLSDTGCRIRQLRLRCGGDPDHLLILHELTNAIGRNTSVESLEVRGAVISRVTSTWLQVAFANKATNLRRVEMTRCKFVRSGRSTMIELSFCSCDMDERDVDVMSSSLPLMDLRSLSLIDANVGNNDAWSYLFHNVGGSSGLTSLDLSRNVLDVDAIGRLGMALMAQKTISSLTLDNGTTLKLAACLRERAGLRSLDVSRNADMTDKVGVHLVELARVNPSIVVLRADGCGLRRKTIDAIDGRLRYNDSFLRNFFSETTSRGIFDFVDGVKERTCQC